MDKQAKIYVAGHGGLVGSGLVRALNAQGYHNLIVRTRAELDLTSQAAVHGFFASEKPDHVFLAAAKVGGIAANANFSADFIRENLLIETHTIAAAHAHGVKRLLFLGSSCIYPKLAPQPLKEEYLLTGPLEETNRAYALAKIAGLELCRSYNKQYGTKFISVMPTNLYGPNDNYHPEHSHVIPALIRRFVEAVREGAKEVLVWGTGAPLREFLHSDDLARACVFLMQLDDTKLPELINIGVGEDISVAQLAQKIARLSGFKGNIRFDATRPDGTPRKCLDISRMKALGWRAQVGLDEGLTQCIREFEARV